jgi:hypothetical protein
MEQTMTRKLTRRACLGLVAFAATPAMAQFGGVDEEENPTDAVPRYFSRERFLSLSENQIYMVGLAVRRGRPIQIEGYSASESRQIIQRAAQDWPATRRSLGGR